MRTPFQILAVPYRFIKNGLYFCVFRRADSDIWQFIAGGGEDNEKPIQAALREIKEETGVTAEKLTELKSGAVVPAEGVAKNLAAHWDKNILRLSATPTLPFHANTANINGCRMIWLENY